MSLKSKFLTLSMKQQISLTIILLSIFSFLVILSITGPLIYETLKEDYKLKKLYFHKKYKEYIETCFFYHNFCLLKYEEIIKRIQRQIWVFNSGASNYNSIFDSGNLNFTNNDDKVINVLNYSKSNYITESNDDVNENLYYLCYCTKHPLNYEIFKFLIRIKYDEAYIQKLTDCEILNKYLVIFYEGYTSLVFVHNIEKAFRLNEFEMPIMTTPLFVYVNDSLLFSFNSSRIYEHVKNKFSDISKFDKYQFEIYFNDIITNFFNTIKDYYLRYKNNEFFLFTTIFEKACNELIEFQLPSFNQNDNNALSEFIKNISGLYSSINYAYFFYSIIC